MSVTVNDYVARIEEACGEEKGFIVFFKHDRKDEAISRILSRANVGKSISKIVFELTFKDVSFRLYGTGRAVFRNVKGKDELLGVLADLLL